MSSISTRTGDGGATGLLHGLRVAKTDPRVEAIGAVDELSACLACASARLAGQPGTQDQIAALQETLVAVMAELATPEGAPRTSPRSRIEAAHLDQLDALVAELEATGIVFRDWNGVRLPDGAAALDLARTICRRAERQIWAVADGFLLSRPLVPKYLNRLSDVLWLLARSGA